MEWGLGNIVKMFRNAGVAEPQKDCHYGIPCDGPMCTKQTEDHYSRHLGEGRPDDWIVGTRYKCTECKEFSLCSACKTLVDSEGMLVKDKKIILRYTRQEAKGLSHTSETEHSDQDSHKAESYTTGPNYGDNHRLGHVLRKFDERKSLGLEESLGE